MAFRHLHPVVEGHSFETSHKISPLSCKNFLCLLTPKNQFVKLLAGSFSFRLILQKFLMFESFR